MKQNEVKIGMEIVLNPLPDAMIYTVTEKRGRMVELKYKVNDREFFSRSPVDCSLLDYPSSIQKKCNC